MTLTKYKDFLDLSIKDSTNYLSACGLNTSNRKVELVARAYLIYKAMSKSAVARAHLICKSMSKSNLLKQVPIQAQ